MCVLNLKAEALVELVKKAKFWFLFLFFCGVFFFFLRSCCQTNSQPLNLKVLLTARSGPSSLVIVVLHLHLMELQKSMLLSFCVPTKSAGRLDNKKKQRREGSGVGDGNQFKGRQVFVMFWLDLLARLRCLSSCCKLYVNKLVRCTNSSGQKWAHQCQAGKHWKMGNIIVPALSLKGEQLDSSLITLLIYICVG